MANIPIWPGSSSFFPGETPFGFYDTDDTFISHSVNTAEWCAKRLGYPIMDVELQGQHFYTCFEEAVTTYGTEVFQYKIRENYLNLEGSTTSSAMNNQLTDPTINRIVQIAKHYGTEAEVGGNVTKYSGKIPITASQQEYDLDQWAEDNDIDGGIEIRKVFYEQPPAITRYFDPYVGTGTGIQSLMDTFGFGQFSPGINFMLMPVSYDIALMQGIEFNDQIRKSAYSFDIVNNQLKVFPVPTRSGSLYFEYYKLTDKSQINYDSSTNLITTVSEVPYENVTYKQINSVGRQWIFRYSLALAKELLAYIRGKYTTVPIPGSDTTLNQSDLLADARSEKETLMAELKEMLNATGRGAQLEAQAKEAADVQETLKSVPMKIYIG